MKKKVICKTQFIKILAKKAHFNYADTKELWRAVEKIFQECIETDTILNISGFGKLEVIDLPERTRTDPRSLEKVYQPPSKRVVFTVGSRLANIHRDVRHWHYRSAERRKQAIAEMMEKQKNK